VVSTKPVDGGILALDQTPAAPNGDPEKPLEVSMHWFSGTCKEFDNLESTTGLSVAFISEVLRHSPDTHPRGCNGYTTTYQWNAELKLMVNTRLPEMGVYFQATGKTCEFYGFDTLAFIGQALRIIPTRLDLAVDGDLFTPLDLYVPWLNDQVRTQARQEKNPKPGREGQRVHTWSSSPSGDNLHMGSKTSTQSARCYNLRGFTRFEMMLRGDRAAQLMQALYDGAELGPTLGAAIDQFVAFVELDDSNRSRCTPMPFWARFMERLGRNEIVTWLEARPEPTRQSLRHWLKHTVSPSLATYAAMESEFESSEVVLKELLREGQERLKSKHYALIAACKEKNSAEGTKILQDTLSSAQTSDECAGEVEDAA
jgi:DNA relaxase NicK